MTYKGIPFNGIWRCIILKSEKQDTINNKLDNIFLKFGFNLIVVNGENVYEHNGVYYKFTFINGLNAYVLETAESLADAEKNLYEDSSDLYSISLGENQILIQVENDIKKYYL